MGGAVITPAQAMKAEQLRCEYLRDPIGLDETKPRLSWILQSGRRADKQIAYQILVASTPELLAQDKGDLWDSGRVNSDETSQIIYSGKPLTSRQTCFWKVRTWDRGSAVGPWSAPARWEMGLLKSEDWAAKWLNGASTPTAGGSLTILKATYGAPDVKIEKDVTAVLQGKVQNGTLEMPVKNDQFGGDPAYNHVKELRVSYRLNGQEGEAVIRENSALSLPLRTLPYMRRTFTVGSRPIRRARLYATALGLYEMRLNGERVGDHVLASEWTDYNKRIRYQAYDVTKQLRSGENALGALIADGWYSGHIGNGGYQHWGKVPALFAQLEITYADGSTERVVTDANWKTHASPILSSDFMLGEIYDARREIAGWDRPGLNMSDWAPALEREETPRPFNGQAMEPVRETQTLKSKTLDEPAPGHWVFDLGQNMVGVVRLRVNAPAGTRLTLRHAEMLNSNGTIYTTNLRGAPSVDTYVCKGGGEVWQPRFTFHGFRYVEITGLPSKPSNDAVTGIVLGSDTPQVGEFACSDPRINQLQSNIWWGQRGNYLSVPTDCPQRDERLGWMGDAEVFVRTATYNADVAAFYTKWLVDVDDAQQADGRFADVSPSTMGANFTGAPAWGDAGVICPWTIYQVYGDRRVLEQHLPAMTRWVEWCKEHSNNLIRDKDRGNDYGDWLSIGANTPKEVIGTAFFAYSTRLLAKSYAAVGKTAEAEKYEKLFQDIKTAFNRTFVDQDGRIRGNTQCDYAMALRFDLLPDTLRPKAVQYLADDIAAKGNHLSTGFVGVSYLLPVLTAGGRLDTAYSLLMQDTFPSWLFSVKHGATTIWERWDGWTPDKGFQDPGMNSFNHYSLGSCGEWLYGGVAGISIDPNSPGFRNVILRPQPGGSLTWAKASYRSIRGTISSSWRVQNGKLTLDVTVPPNTTATVYVPTSDPSAVQEGGNPVHESEGIHPLRQESGAAVFNIGSGTYSFSAPTTLGAH